MSIFAPFFRSRPCNTPPFLSRTFFFKITCFPFFPSPRKNSPKKHSSGHPLSPPNSWSPNLALLWFIFPGKSLTFAPKNPHEFVNCTFLLINNHLRPSNLFPVGPLPLLSPLFPFSPFFLGNKNIVLFFLLSSPE